MHSIAQKALMRTHLQHTSSTPICRLTAPRKRRFFKLIRKSKFLISTCFKNTYYAQKGSISDQLLTYEFINQPKLIHRAIDATLLSNSHTC